MKCEDCVYYKDRKKPHVGFSCIKQGQEPDSRPCYRFQPKVCGECAYYLTGTCPVYSTEELKPQKKACLKFVDRTAFQKPDVSPTLSMSKEDEKLFSRSFRGIISRIFAFEKAAVEALKKVEAELEQQGVYVPFSQPLYERIVSNTSKAYLITEVAKLAGLDEDIVRKLLNYELYYLNQRGKK